VKPKQRIAAPPVDLKAAFLKRLTVAVAGDPIPAAAMAACAAAMADSVTRCADLAVTPTLRAAVLARPEVVDRWPVVSVFHSVWGEVVEHTGGSHQLTYTGSDSGRPPVAGDELRWRWNMDMVSLGGSVIDADERVWTLVREAETPERPAGWWPGEAAPVDVARWVARDKRLEPTSAREIEERARNMRGRRFDEWTVVRRGAVDPEAYPPAGLALLYLAEREVEAGLRRPAVAIDAGKHHHELLSGWKGIPRDGVRHRAAPGGAAVMDGRVELLLPGTATQLALPLPMEGLSASAVALLRELRGAAGLRHWCALQRLLSVEGGRQGWVRWTLDEHLEAMGYGASTREDPTKRAEAAAEVEVLTKLELVVYDATNTLRSRAPLLMVGVRFERIAGAKWALEGMELKINELLYRGVRTPGGKVGTNWMPTPVELAKLDHARHPYAHGLGMLLAIRMRWDIGDDRALRLTGRTLLDLAGILYAERRAVEAWRKLERELDALAKVELLTYRWDADPWTLAAVCEVAPAGWMMDRVGRGLVPVERPPAVIPRTGAELVEWRTARGWSQRAAAGRLGVGQSTLSNAEAKPDAALSDRVVDALKQLETDRE